MTTPQTPTRYPPQPGGVLPPVSWDGSALDMTLFGSVTILCTVAPSAPYTVVCGDGAGNTVQRTLVSDVAGAIGTTPTIATAGAFSVPGGGSVALTGGTGGTFLIGGGQ